LKINFESPICFAKLDLHAVGPTAFEPVMIVLKTNVSLKKE